MISFEILGFLFTFAFKSEQYEKRGRKTSVDRLRFKAWLSPSWQ
jgi:hypothetical protein